MALILVAGAQACGHLPFDEIPDFDAAANPDALSSSSSSGSSSSSSGSSGGSSSSGTVTDGSTPNPDGSVGLDGSTVEAGGPGTIVYVSEKVGRKGATGTREDPVPDTTEAVALLSNTRNQLYFAAGNYDAITLAASKSSVQVIKGGFHCEVGDCTWAESAEATTIAAKNVLDGALSLDDGTVPILIANLRFKGTTGGAGTAGGVTLGILRRVATLMNVTIDGPITIGGAAGSRRSVALLVRGGGTKVSIVNSTIRGGQGGDVAAGIVVEDGPLALSANERPVLTLSDSKVYGGTATSSYAILLSSAGMGTSIDHNEITAIAPNDASGESWAISVGATNSTPEVDITKNTINRLTTVGAFCLEHAFCGGIFAIDSKVTIRNNVIRGVPAQWSAAVFLENTRKTQPVMIVNGNLIDGGGGTTGATDNRSAAVVIKNTYSATAKFGSVRNNILVGGQGQTSFGVHEHEGTTNEAHLAAFSNNAIAAAVTYRAFQPPATPKNYSGTDGLKNIPVDGVDPSNLYEKLCPLLADGVHLDATKANVCLGTGISKEAPADDIDGQPRSNPTDIGADQH